MICNKVQYSNWLVDIYVLKSYLVHIGLGLGQFLRTCFGLWIHYMHRIGHPIPPLNLLYGLLVVHSWVGNLTVSEYLHQEDAVTPDI